MSLLMDNTYLVNVAQTTPLAWPGGARIAQVRILAIDTTASCSFQAIAGTSIFEWRYIFQTFAGGTSDRTVINGMHVFPLGGVRFPSAWIPTTLTACTAWIDFC